MGLALPLSAITPCMRCSPLQEVVLEISMVDQGFSGWTCRQMASEVFFLPSPFEMEEKRGCSGSMLTVAMSLRFGNQ